MFGMTWIEGGKYRMGSDKFYPEESPVRPVRVDGFWMDITPVTNSQFAEFVRATGYVTVAETTPDPKDYPGMLPEMAKAGSLVFMPTRGPVDLNNFSAWWQFVFGADWRHPLGPESSIDDIMDHPVVQIAYEDAAAYAHWAGKDLPTEAEWEFAARGDMPDREYAWGDELAPRGEILANYWQGEFPWQNLALDGYSRTSPVRAYVANVHGLYDMIGNVWEWTADWYTAAPAEKKKAACCIPHNPRGAAIEDSFDPCMPDILIGRKVLKGGSHLCAPNYCQRYRPAARYPQTIDTSTSHIGFRCIKREKQE